MPPFEYYDDPQPTRKAVDAMTGPVLLEFGAAWCGFCQALQPELATIRTRFPNVRHIKIEDGKGRPLGRSFGVKLWPTLVFMQDGKIAHQSSRPSPREIEAGFETLGKSNG